MNRIQKLFCTIAFILWAFFSPAAHVHAAPSIQSVSDNKNTYPNSSVPQYEKLEITFHVDGVTASNVQFPYLNQADAGTYLEKYVDMGISVDAVFTDPDGKVHKQPAFYYQEFLDQIKNSKEWLYPTNNYSWKVRFAPNKAGTWKYKLTAIDKGGTVESPEVLFTVVPSTNKGFLKVAQNDPRYFEFDNGEYFPAQGVNYPMGSLSHETELQQLKDNGINFVRSWLAPMNIYGTTWSAWEMMPGHYDGYLPRTPILPYQETTTSPTEFLYFLQEGSTWYEECAFLGHTQAHPAVKSNTNYFIRAVYKVADLTGPRDPTFPNYGFVIKYNGWPGDKCRDPGNGTTPLTNYGQVSSQFAEVKGIWNSGTSNFLDNFYIALENASTGKVYIKSIEVFEMTGGTLSNPVLTGPNLIEKHNANEHLYMTQTPSYKMDKIVDKIKQYDVYVKPVIMEKQEYLFMKLDEYGDPTFTDDQNRFYGYWHREYAIRWLQKAWWRYLQARWGYSTNIHSWELLNEGNPFNGHHYTLTDTLGRYMHCEVFGIPVPDLNNSGTKDGDRCLNIYDHPNDHMVSTSTWHSFPKNEFWGSIHYPNVDFADVHKYVPATDPLYGDTALSTYTESMNYGAKQSGGAGKPVIRGETGFGSSSNTEILTDTQGIWLHNYIWGGINSGGLIEHYWYYGEHIYKRNSNGTVVFDHRPHYKAYHQFIRNIPLNNGKYQDIAATVGNTNLRAWGQKDVVNGNAHVWIQNKNHTWKNVIAGTPINGETGGVVICGLNGYENQTFTLETWDTYAGTKQTGTIAIGNTGCFTLSISDLTTDVAFKVINPAAPSPTIQPTVTTPPAPGDTDGDNDVDIFDYNVVIGNFGQSVTGAGNGDLDTDGDVDIFDYNLVISNFGR